MASAIVANNSATARCTYHQSFTTHSVRRAIGTAGYCPKIRDTRKASRFKPTAYASSQSGNPYLQIQSHAARIGPSVRPLRRAPSRRNIAASADKHSDRERLEEFERPPGKPTDLDVIVACFTLFIAPVLAADPYLNTWDTKLTAGAGNLALGIFLAVMNALSFHRISKWIGKTPRDVGFVFEYADVGASSTFLSFVYVMLMTSGALTLGTGEQMLRTVLFGQNAICILQCIMHSTVPAEDH